ncbi:MAG: nucleotide-binding protein [Acutalibacter sp.]|nr:nucleotide-binding protein [Acutalibacter sp.]
MLFEHGFCLHKLGRKRVCFLVEEGAEIPSDLSGLTYIPLDSGGAWRFTLESV